MKLDTNSERRGALDALMAWFQSQDIEPVDACWMAATMCGMLVPDKERLEILVECMRDARKQVRAMERKNG